MPKTHSDGTMKKTSKPKKIQRVKEANKPVKKHISEDAAIPAFIEPTVHDMYDELYRLDSFAYSRYNS